MTENPQDDTDDVQGPGQSPLDAGDAARQVAHLTGMTPESAETFAAFHSGRFAPFRRAA
jgi:hypothetical protein